MVYKKTIVSQYGKINRENEVGVSKFYLRSYLVFLLMMCLWNTNIGYGSLFLYFLNFVAEIVSEFYFLVGFSLIFSFIVILFLVFMMFLMELFFLNKEL